MSVSTITIILSCAVALFSIVISVYSYVVFHKMKDYEIKRLRKQIAGVNYQREKLENEIYGLNDRLTSDKQGFIDINHLLISEDDQKMVIKQSVSDASFFQERGIDFSKYTVSADMITCLMPFNHKYDKIYKAISNACVACGYKAIRSDDHFVSGDILKYTIELILKAQIVIAVIDGRNPNVFYELGIAHSLGKQVLILSSFQDLPFDVQNNRMILYRNDKDLETKLVDALTEIK